MIQDFAQSLTRAQRPERFVHIFCENPQNDGYYTTNVYGLALPDNAPTFDNDQEFETWQNSLGAYHNLAEILPCIELGTYHYGYTLMPCISCDAKQHQEPIIVHRWCPYPRHSVSIAIFNGALGNKFLTNAPWLSVYGGVIRAMPCPQVTGELPVGMLILQVEPYRMHTL